MSGRSLTAALRTAARQALRSGDHEAADEAVARLEAVEPRSLETRGLRLEVLMRAGRRAEAAALLEPLLADHPDSPRVRFLAGRLRYGAREYEDALRQFVESERLHPTAWTRLHVGRTLTQLGRFDEAEATLLGVADHVSVARRDLAWLYERRGNDRRALAECERYLGQKPDDPVAKSQRLRLRARATPPDELKDEVEEMAALGEDVAPEVVPEYVEGLFRTGEAAAARAFVAEHAGRWDDRVRTGVAWSAYKMQAYDVAFDLFAEVFGVHRANPKFVTAFEAAARRADRIDRAIEVLEQHAPNDRRLYGRAKSLRKHLPRG